MAPLRVLAAADIHGIPPVYEWLVEEANRWADVLILAGDLFAGDLAENQKKKSKEIVGILHAVRDPTLYLMGNDDEVELGYEDELIQPLHGRTVTIGGTAFLGYQYTPPFAGEAFVKTEGEIAADLRELEPKARRGTVFVTHAPALGSADLTYGGEQAGSSAIGEFLHRITVLAHIHGHIHNAFGRDGNHFNVASAGTCRAMRIELPSLASEVVRLEATTASP